MNTASVKFSAKKLQEDYAIAHDLNETDYNIEAAQARIEMRTSHLVKAGFHVFADEHDVMLITS